MGLMVVETCDKTNVVILSLRFILKKTIANFSLEKGFGAIQAVLVKLLFPEFGKWKLSGAQGNQGHL